MTVEQRAQLDNWVRAPSTPQKIVLRARICLLANEGLANRRIASGPEHQSADRYSVAQSLLKAGVAGLEARTTSTDQFATHRRRSN